MGWCTPAPWGTIGNESSKKSPAADGGGGAILNVVLAAHAFKRGAAAAGLDKNSTEVLCSGWLRKTPVVKPGDAGVTKRGAKRRWFTLRGRTLEYWKAPNDAKPKGALVITHDTVCTEVDATQNIFEVAGACITKGGVEYIGGSLVMQASGVTPSLACWLLRCA